MFTYIGSEETNALHGPVWGLGENDDYSNPRPVYSSGGAMLYPLSSIEEEMNEVNYFDPKKQTFPWPMEVDTSSVKSFIATYVMDDNGNKRYMPIGNAVINGERSTPEREMPLQTRERMYALLSALKHNECDSHCGVYQLGTYGGGPFPVIQKMVAWWDPEWFI
mgnify:CR=1 FL=1